MLGFGLATGIFGLVVALLGGYSFLTKRFGGGVMIVAGIAVATFAAFTIVVDPLDVFAK